MNEEQIFHKVCELLGGGELTPEVAEGVRKAIQDAEEAITDILLLNDGLYFFSKHKLIRGTPERLEPLVIEDEWPDAIGDILDSDVIGDE